MTVKTVLLLCFMLLANLLLSQLSIDSVLSDMNRQLSKIGDRCVLDYNWNIPCFLGPDGIIERDVVMQAVSLFMKEHSDWRFEIGYHTDCRGAAWYNLELSQRIANNLKGELLKLGVDELKVTAMGYGGRLPIVKCNCILECTDTDYEKNRRVEILLLSNEKR